MARTVVGIGNCFHHRGYGTFTVDGETIRLPSRMP